MQLLISCLAIPENILSVNDARGEAPTEGAVSPLCYLHRIKELWVTEGKGRPN